VRSILLDPDIGSDVDDVLALGLILACPNELSLVAVTTICGDTELRARIAAGLLALAGHEGIDVCAGERKPLLRSQDSFAWFGHEKRCAEFSCPGGRPKISSEPAPERIVRAARETPDLEIVAIGPLTNLARALALDPELPNRVKSLTIMGGHIREVKIGEHVCAPGIDYNMCSDPEATMAVLGAGFAITLVTADITLDTWMNTRDLEVLSGGGELARSLAEQVRLWSPVQRALFTGIGGTMAEDNEAFLHDPLTVLALIDASALTFEHLRILPTIEAGVLRTFELPPETDRGSEMRVATRVDAKQASRQIAQRLSTL
jgi:purine nucleosidase